MLRLRTVGRRSGEERTALLGYLEDGSDLVLVAMNGWMDPEPAWWLNLKAKPDASVELPGGAHEVTAREAIGEERSRLWAKLAFVGRSIDDYAALRSRKTPVVILEPRRERSEARDA
jgi:deazaflavin-dependent oxidoreductase (nitroreductase family)